GPGRGRGSGAGERTPSRGGSGGKPPRGKAGGGQRSGPPRRGPTAQTGSSVRYSDRGDRRTRPSATTSRYGLGGDQVEGRQAVRELLLAGTRKVREIFLAEDLDPAPVLDDIRQLAREQRVMVTELGRKALDRRSYTESSQGVVAEAAELKPVELEDLVADGGRGGSPFLLALDGVTDPRNLGALLRTAECAGVDGVILPRHRAAHVTPTVTKTAAGAVEHLPMALVGGLPAAIESLRSAGVWVVGLDSAGPTSLYDLTVATQPICLVAGAEGKGLSRLVARRCDEVVSLPLRGSLDSLNVAAAVAIATYEITRRRSL
ncbi:MAG: 23S rRNA (guanosine(2251)-2'-O)-methyltransferase RlmB, partial [Candidatus Microthrix subdominans]